MQNNALRGIGLMCLAMTLLPVMNGFAKYLGEVYPVSQVIWARYTGHLIFIILVFMPRRGFALFRTISLGSQVFRSFLLLASTVCYFTALQYMPMATAAAINFVTPFIVTGLSVPMLKEQVGPRRWIAIVIGFVGALIIIRPGFAGLHWSALLVIGTAFFYALFQVLTRRNAGQEDSGTTIFYTALVGTIAMCAVIPFYFVMPTEPIHWLLFLVMGPLGGMGHYFAIIAFRHAQVSVLAPFLYVQLIGATIFGYLYFGDFPDAMTWFGAAIIVVSGIYIAEREARTQG